MKQQMKEMLRKEYAQFYAEGTDMHKHLVNGVSDAVVINGNIFEVDKRGIKTDFCFGYSTCYEDSYDYEEAQERCRLAGSDGGEYFKAVNLERFDEDNKPLRDDRVYAVYRKYGKGNICEVVGSSLHYDETCFVKFLNDDEKTQINALINRERNKFEKRLDNYLKRYGTSKLHCWTYWMDE